MSRFWRRIAPVVMAGGLIAASGAIPAEAASPAASITIAAKVRFPVITGDHLVIYKGTHGFGTAAIHGQITGAKAGDTATLLSEPFGAKRFSATGKPITLAAASAPYSFTVQPTLATKYEVQVTNGKTFLARSGVETVYVTPSAVYKGARDKCSRTVCDYSINVYAMVPPSAYRTESAKHYYLYLAVGYPRIPKNYTLANGKVSRPRRINAGEFELSITWYVPLRNGTAHWLPNFCSRDTVTRDGLGLPGHHGCGDTTVSVKQANTYLG